MQQLFTINRSGPVNEGLPSIRLELSTRSHSHTALIIGIAGLALIPALVGSLRSAFSEPGQLEAPALTFLTAASGMTLFGVSGAFWGLVLGGAGLAVEIAAQPPDRAFNRAGRAELRQLHPSSPCADRGQRGPSL